MEIPPDAVRRTTNGNGRGTDYAFLTVGSIEALHQGFDMLGRREMMVVIGIARGTRATSDLEIILMNNEVTLNKSGSSSENPIDFNSILAKLERRFSSHPIL
jgi:threonine dehydrogenase-like Zn-dependent dehydrogenase